MSDTPDKATPLTTKYGRVKLILSLVFFAGQEQLLEGECKPMRAVGRLLFILMLQRLISTVAATMLRMWPNGQGRGCVSRVL